MSHINQKRKIFYKKIILFPLFILFLLTFCKKQIFAKEMVLEEEAKSIIIVMDHSGSMNIYDKYRSIPQIMATLLDVLEEERINIGFVAYNDRILTQHPLIPVETKSERENLKAAIMASPYEGETDIGLGLYTAYEMLKEAPGTKSILLLSDGETDLALSTRGRSKADSDRDVEEVVRLCQTSGISVSAISFGAESDKAELNDMAVRTNGQVYLAKEAGELVTIFGDLFLDDLSFSLKEMGSSVYGAGTQKINYESSTEADVLTIMLLSNQTLRGIGVSEQRNGEVIQLPDSFYATSRIKDPEGDFSITFDTLEQQRVWVFVLEKREVIPALLWSQGIKRNGPSVVSISFSSGSGVSLLEKEGVKELTWTGKVVQQATGKETPMNIEKREDTLQGTVYLEESGEYTLYLNVGSGITNRYVSSGITVGNTLPKSHLSQKLEFLSTSEEMVIDLQEYVSDSDGDTLTFELQDVPKDIVEVAIRDNQLIIRPIGRGAGEIKLMVSDGEGGLAVNISVRVKNFFEAYGGTAAIILAALALILWSIFHKKESDIPLPIRIEERSEGSFTGKLNAYFTRLPEEMEEIPPLSFALYPIREKKIVLKDMLADYPQLADILELDKIFFFPAEGRELIIYQESTSTVMVGNSLVCRRMQYIISCGNVIYITSKDGKYELEVHYISMI